MSKTFKFIIINSVFLLGMLSGIRAQEVKPVKKPIEKSAEKTDTAKTKMWQGVFVEVDIAPLIESALINKYAYTFQGNLMANLDNRFFPLIELGYAGAEKTTGAGVSFKTSGMFQKIGIDFRLLKPKQSSPIRSNHILGGVRLGMIHFNYSIANVLIEDPYWGGSEIINENAIPAAKFWLEFTAGLRVSLYKNVYVGWNARNKRLLNKAKEGENAPWYIPGYGLGNSPIWGFSYTVGYKF